MTSTTVSPLKNTNIDEINSYLAGSVSLIGNVALIYATSRVKVYSKSFRWMQYYVCVLRLLFSAVVVLTSPTLAYVAKMKTLYIVKGGFYLPFNFGLICLVMFIFSVVISCSSPTIQYLQLWHVLSERGNNKLFAPLISTVSVLTGLPALVLVSIAYTPTDLEVFEAKDTVYYLNGEGDCAFLVVSQENKDSLTRKTDWSSKICTFYILSVMVISVITVVLCSLSIRKYMEKKLMSASGKKYQKQVNLVLTLQFILPFLTIYVPFFVSFILPMFDVENTFLSTNLPFLFSWCPAINPILVLLLVKTVRDRLLSKKSVSKVSSINNHNNLTRQPQVLASRAH